MFKTISTVLFLLFWACPNLQADVFTRPETFAISIDLSEDNSDWATDLWGGDERQSVVEMVVNSKYDLNLIGSEKSNVYSSAVEAKDRLSVYASYQSPKFGMRFGASIKLERVNLDTSFELLRNLSSGLNENELTDVPLEVDRQYWGSNSTQEIQEIPQPTTEMIVISELERIAFNDLSELTQLKPNGVEFGGSRTFRKNRF